MRARRAARLEPPLPPGDVIERRADFADLRRDVGFAPNIPLAEGVERFARWYRGFHSRP